MAALAEAGARRSAERYRRAALYFFAAATSKGMALAALLVSVPLALGYLGNERFGIWMTAVSAAGLLSFANLGFDKGLLNALAAAHGRNNRGAARRLVATAFALLGGVFALLLLAFVLAYPFTPWPRLLNVAAAEAGDAGPVMMVLVACTLVALLGGLVETVHAGYQEGFLNAPWDALGKLLGLLALLAAVQLHASLPLLALAVAGAPLLAFAGNAALLFAGRRPWLLPRPSLVRQAAARRLIAAGGLFFLSQLALTLAYHADNLIVAQLAGSEAVAVYVVVARLFDIPGMLLLLAGSALWPPLAEAIARGDVGWAERGLARLVLVSLVLVAATALPLMLLGPRALAWWTGAALDAPPQLFLAFGLFWLLSALTQSFAVFFSAANALRFQLAATAALALASLALKLLLAPGLGIAGVAWGRVIAEALLLVPYAWYLPRMLRRLRSGELR